MKNKVQFFWIKVLRCKTLQYNQKYKSKILLLILILTEYISTELDEQNEDENIRKDIEEDENINPQDFYDTDVLEEIYGISKEESKESMLYETENQFQEVINEDAFERFVDIPGINEINDDNIEPLEEVRLL